MDDINTRLCELLGCDVPRPKDICPTCGKTNTDGKMRFIDGADFFSEKGRIDLLKRMMKNPDFVEHSGVFYYPPDHGFIEPDSLLISTKYMTDDTGALARAALEFLTGHIIISNT